MWIRVDENVDEALQWIEEIPQNDELKARISFLLVHDRSYKEEDLAYEEGKYIQISLGLDLSFSTSRRILSSRCTTQHVCLERAWLSC